MSASSPALRTTSPSLSSACARALVVLLSPVALLACASTATAPAGDVALQRVCTTLDVDSGFGECLVRITVRSGSTATINTVTLIGASGQPVTAGFGYGGNLGLRFYSDPTPATLAGQAVGSTGFEFLVRAVISVGDGETTPAPGTYAAAVRVNVTPAGGASATLEVPVSIRVR